MAIEIALAISREASGMVRKSVPDLTDITCVDAGTRCNAFFSEQGWLALRVVFDRRISIPSGPVMTPEDMNFVKSKIIGVPPTTLKQAEQLLGVEWVAEDRLTYVGQYQGQYVSWPDIAGYIVDWLNGFVLPHAIETNRQRVLRAIPEPPAYDVSKIARSLWVLECDTDCEQGSAFMLDEVGLVTCNHCLATNTMAFRHDAPTKKFPVSVVKRHDVIDLAVLSIDFESAVYLPRGRPDDLKVMDHLLVSGHPNYRLGDSAVVVPGFVVGFRMKSAIRRIITNAAIVAGSSGGPVLNRSGEVIGVAVTGSRSFTTSGETEDHGVIPIDALDLL